MRTEGTVQPSADLVYEVTVQPTSETGHLWPTTELPSGHLRPSVDENTAVFRRSEVQLCPFPEVG
jgi:hypothetical protein